MVFTNLGSTFRVGSHPVLCACLPLHTGHADLHARTPLLYMLSLSYLDAGDSWEDEPCKWVMLGGKKSRRNVYPCCGPLVSSVQSASYMALGSECSFTQA